MDIVIQKLRFDGRIIKTVEVIVALIPITWVVLFYTLAYQMSSVLRRWPIPMRDDPRGTIPDGPFTTLDDILGYLAVGLLIIVVPVGIAMTVYVFWKPEGPKKHRLKPDFPTVLFWIGFAGLLFVTQVDLHHFFDWWLD